MIRKKVVSEILKKCKVDKYVDFYDSDKFVKLLELEFFPSFKSLGELVADYEIFTDRDEFLEGLNRILDIDNITIKFLKGAIRRLAN